jgi:hypothetical protein
MKFRVIGSSKETGARMTLEFEAQSKAAAERKAQQAGMAVNRVENLSVLDAETFVPTVRSGVGGRLIKIIVLIGLVAAAYFVLRSRGVIH